MSNKEILEEYLEGQCLASDTKVVTISEDEILSLMDRAVEEASPEPYQHAVQTKVVFNDEELDALREIAADMETDSVVVIHRKNLTSDVYLDPLLHIQDSGSVFTHHEDPGCEVVLSYSRHQRGSGGAFNPIDHESSK